MIPQPRTWCARLCALAVSCAWASFAHAGNSAQPAPPIPQAAAGSLPAQMQGPVKRLEAVLKAQGYDVARGATKLFTIADCKYPIAVIGNCLGNNPAAPYVIATVPLWSDEYVDNGMRNLLGPLPDKTWGTHRFDQREAVLVVGQLPPPAKYFGLQTYVFTRETQVNTSDPIYRSVTDPYMHQILFGTSSEPSRLVMFASIGNSNNDVVVKRQSGAAFSQQRAFVVSTDAALSRELTAALVRAGLCDKDNVFAEPVSGQVARLGLDREADDFMTVIRYAQPLDERAGNRWRQHPPLLVLRVRDKGAHASEPWPKPAYDPKTARPELALAGDLAQLVAAIKQRWGQPSAPSTSFESLQVSVDLIGQHCLLRPMNCLGDTQDADYQVSPALMPDANHVIAVAGTLGTRTGNATYVGLSVNWLSVLQGVSNLSDRDLAGSARPFASMVANSGKFYVQYFARDCRGIRPCQTITEQMVPRGEAVKVIQRNYVVPGSARGADPSQVLNPVAIVLDRAAMVR